MKYSHTTLVTGATGFIGRHLVELLVSQGVNVRATGLPGGDLGFFEKLGVEFVPSDLTREETLPPLFGGSVACVFHLGAICNLSTPYARLAPINVEGVERITRLALKAGVERYVHVGSTSVYGRGRGQPFKEEDVREPADSYGRSKRDGEDVVWRRVQEGLPAIVTRPCTVYGPGCTDGAGKAFSRPTSISAIPGDGKQRLSNVRVEDVAGAVVHLSTIDAAVGKAFNIADDSNPTLEHALTLAAHTFGRRPPKLHLPLALVGVLARVDGVVSSRLGKVPDLEYDAVAYLKADYVVDNSMLKQTGYSFRFPDFDQSMHQLGRIYRSGAEL